MKYEPVIGLEIHLQLNTESKMFCGCSNVIFGKQPNSLTCPTCLGLPGALPVPNRKAVEYAQLLGLALGCELVKFSKFDRKNYFYPDLPKGYQISQYDSPLATGGKMEIKDKNEKVKFIRIRRVHLEEDTGKSIHKKNYTLLDFNKSGVPLVEVVTEPDIKNAEQAVEFGKEIQKIVRQLGIGQADMEKGQLRLEPNISLKRKAKSEKRKVEDKLPDYKVELKNINSFRFMKKAIEYEIKRQQKELEAGKKLFQETRGWNEKKSVTVSQRVKEEEQDYRYFPEPDIPPMRFNESYIKKLKEKLSKVSIDAEGDLENEWGISKDKAKILVRNKKKLEYVRSLIKLGEDSKKAVAIVVNMSDGQIDEIKPKDLLAERKAKKDTQVTEGSKISKWVSEVIKEEEKAAVDYKGGNLGALNYLQGKVMAKSQGKADPKIVRESLKKQLDK